MTTQQTTSLDRAVSAVLTAFAAKTGTPELRDTLEAFAAHDYTDETAMLTRLSTAADAQAFTARWREMEADALQQGETVNTNARHVATEWRWALSHLAYGLWYSRHGGSTDANLLLRLSETLNHIARVTPYPEA